MSHLGTEKYPLRGRKHFRGCDHPGCSLEGEYRAPKSRDNLRDYFWFCLTHIRAYNASWNFCAGMDPSDIDSMIKKDVCWGRPTWPLGHNGGADSRAGKVSTPTEKDTFAHRHDFRGRIYDPFDVYEQATSHFTGGGGNSRAEALSTHPEREAYGTLGFDYPADEGQVKARYRKLVKDLHPDLNCANPEAVERLKDVNQAYCRLKKSFS